MSPTGLSTDFPIGLILALLGVWLVFFSFLKDRTEEIHSRSNSALKIASRIVFSASYKLTVGLYILATVITLHWKFPPSRFLDVIFIGLASGAFLAVARLLFVALRKTPSPFAIAGIALAFFGLVIEILPYFGVTGAG